jgi:hypothetical protein
MSYVGHAMCEVVIGRCGPWKEATSESVQYNVDDWIELQDVL